MAFYPKGEPEKIERSIADGGAIEATMLTVDSPMSEIPQVLLDDLKYSGLVIADIESISFTLFKQPREYHDTGEKKVPNVISIPFRSDPRVDYDMIYRNFIVSKINRGTELIPHEREKFIGITLGMNDWHIDLRVLEHLGFNEKSVLLCNNILYHAYTTRERRGKLTDSERPLLDQCKCIRDIQNAALLTTEIAKAKVRPVEFEKMTSVFEMVFTSLSRFEAEVLLYCGNRIVFWDANSYLHIVLRHVKQLQMGTFKKKSTFPYKFEDLRLLVGKIVSSVDGEIRRHLEETPNKEFRREGRMSVVYNDDYYSLRIDRNGRLVTLYMAGN